MMTFTNRPKSGRTTYHRDGTVTLWCVLSQSWMRGRPNDAVMSTLSGSEWGRVNRYCHG